jgi:hypothetical protein
VGPALARIDAALAAAERLIPAGEEEAVAAIGLVHCAQTVAATETLGATAAQALEARTDEALGAGAARSD